MAETKAETVERKRVFWKRSRWCNYIGLALGIAVATPLFVMLFDRREPVQLYQGKFIPDQATPGQSITIVWEAEEMRTGCDGWLERRVLERKTGKVHAFKREPTLYHMIGPEGGRQTFSKDFTIPEAITAGEAEYQTIGERWCNVIQKYVWAIPFRSPPIAFTVIEKPKPVALPPSIQLKDLEIKLKPKSRIQRRLPQ